MPGTQAERVNHFLKGERKVTETDAALAIAYYPLLVDLARNRRTIAFSDFVDLAKTTYPKNPAVQNAIPVSTGRRLEFIRVFTAVNGLPDLSAWVTGKSGKNSAAYEGDFNPVEERRRSAEVDWSEHQAAWEAHAAELRKLAKKITPRSEMEARFLMAEFAKEMRPKIEAAIPNPEKRPYVTLVAPFRETILQDLMSGLDPEDVFENVLIDMRNARD
jgi:hypothetical protein